MELYYKKKLLKLTLMFELFDESWKCVFKVLPIVPLKVFPRSSKGSNKNCFLTRFKTKLLSTFEKLIIER